MCLSRRRGLYTPNSSGLGEVDMSGRSMSIYTRTSLTIYFFCIDFWDMTKNRWHQLEENTMKSVTG